MSWTWALLFLNFESRDWSMKAFPLSTAQDLLLICSTFDQLMRLWRTSPSGNSTEDKIGLEKRASHRDAVLVPGGCGETNAPHDCSSWLPSAFGLKQTRTARRALLLSSTLPRPKTSRGQKMTRRLQPKCVALVKVESSHSAETQRSTSAMVACKQILDPPEPDRKTSADGSLRRCWLQTPPVMETCVHFV